MSRIANNEDLKAKKNQKNQKTKQKNPKNQKTANYCYLQFLVPVKTNVFT